jgi:hypothetical protein
MCSNCSPGSCAGNGKCVSNCSPGSGAGNGKCYSVNVPLKEGMDDLSYELIFQPIMRQVQKFIDAKYFDIVFPFLLFLFLHYNVKRIIKEEEKLSRLFLFSISRN